MERHFKESVLEALPARYDSLLQQIEDEQAGAAYDMGASCAGWGRIWVPPLSDACRSPGAQP